MGRLWLALAVVVVLGGSALANRDPACACAVARVLPAPGSVDVPTNAKLWRVPATSDPAQPIASYELAPHTHYEIHDGGTSFTTGAGPEYSPPVEPGLASVSITLAGEDNGGRKPVSILHVASMMDRDVAVVRLTFVDDLGEVTYYTTPDALSVCDPGIDLTAGHVRVTLTAFDLAGHASVAQTFETTTTFDHVHRPSCGHVRGPCVPPYFVVFAPFAGLLLLALVLSLNARVRERANAVPAPMAIPAVEALARTIRLRALLLLVAIPAVASYALTTHGLITFALFLSPVLVVIAYIALEATRALGLLRYDGVTAEAKTDEVAIVVGKRRVTLRAPRWLVNRARYHGVPKATL